MAAATYTYDADATKDVVTPRTIAIGFKWTASAPRWVGVGVRLSDSQVGIKACYSAVGVRVNDALPVLKNFQPGTTYSFSLDFYTNDDDWGASPPNPTNANWRSLGTAVISITTPAE